MSLLFPGDTDFEQSGPPEWQPNGWDLDRLILPYRGDVDQLNTFVASLTMWSASLLDSNMFLESFPNDGHQQFPTVRVSFIGKQGGTLPPDKNTTGETVQTASFTSYSGKTRVNITYLAPSSTKRTWSRTPIDVSTVSPAAPAAATVIAGTFHTEDSEYTAPANEAGYLAFFTAVPVTTGECEELVPGEYYVATRVKQNMLFSNNF